jgi:hypothetical protein
MPNHDEEEEIEIDPELLLADEDDLPPPLLNFGLGSDFHKEVMREQFPEVAARMPLEEQQLFCRRCGHRDDRWHGTYCPKCGESWLKA